VRGWWVHEHGPPSDALVLGDGPTPEPGPREVVIEVGACALNFADDLLCRGTYQERPALPFVPGLEVAGRVVAAGPRSRHPIGGRVSGSTLLPHGGLAERCAARDDDVFPLPDDLDDVDAAAMHVTYQTAWFALHRRGNLQPGETLVVHAAAGGAGSAAVQLGRAAGARVVAVAGGADKVARCRELGADLVVDHRSEDFVDAVLDLTGGRGADVVFDPVGGDTFLRSTRCIAWEGRILVIGAAGGAYAEARTNHVLVKNYAVVGVHWGGYRTRRPDLVAAAHDELVRLRTSGAVSPIIGAVLPFGQARDGLLELTAGRTVGKLVVKADGG
jgi:NADPH:quinone reductase